MSPQHYILIFAICVYTNFGVVFADNVSNDSEKLSNKEKVINRLPEVGDKYQGGIVFHVDGTGRHGLISSLSDQTEGVRWYQGKDLFKTGANADGIGAGAENTKKIIAAQGDGLYAARVAANFKVQSDGVTPCSGDTNEICYSDWYLPSKLELNLLYFNRKLIGGFYDNENVWSDYCSSTELNEYNIWAQRFDNGIQQLTAGKSSPNRVRAIRAY